MKLVVISSPDLFQTEVNTVINLFKAGLRTFHLRKPKFDRERIESYLEQIPARYHKRIVLHSHHKLAIKYKLKGVHLTKTHRKRKWLSIRLAWLKVQHPKLIFTRTFHRLQDVTQSSRRYRYVFLSPVFDINVDGSKNRYGPTAISKVLDQSHSDVYALGGINLNTIEEAKSLGFNGAALQGALWSENSDRVDFVRSAMTLIGHKQKFRRSENEEKA